MKDKTSMLREMQVDATNAGKYAALLNGLYAPDVHAPHAPHALRMYMMLMLMRCKDVCNAVASFIKL